MRMSLNNVHNSAVSFIDPCNLARIFVPEEETAIVGSGRYIFVIGTNEID